MFVQNVKLSVILSSSNVLMFFYVILWWTVYYIFNRPDVVDHIIQKPVFKRSYFQLSLTARHRQGEHGQYMVRQNKQPWRGEGRTRETELGWLEVQGCRPSCMSGWFHYHNEIITPMKTPKEIPKYWVSYYKNIFLNTFSKTWLDLSSGNSFFI